MIDTELIALYKDEATLERQILAYRGIISELEKKSFMKDYSDCLEAIIKELERCTRIYDRNLSGMREQGEIRSLLRKS